MKSLEQQMAFYAAYHRDWRNKLTHFIGVPLIVFGVMLALSWVRVPLGPLELTPAMAAAAWVMIYYLLLDLSLGCIMILVLGALLAGADAVSRLSVGINAAVFLLTFGGGWVIQLVGHVYEGRKPALTDNLFQVFVAPIFLAAEVLFALGMRRTLHGRIESLSHAFDVKPVAGPNAPTQIVAD